MPGVKKQGDLFLIFCAYYLIATWNEETDKFIVEITKNSKGDF